MNTKIITAIATFGCALLGLTAEARADFLVLCPNGGYNAAWSHTAGVQFTGPFTLVSRKQLEIRPTRVLRCDILSRETISLSYATTGQCGGTVSMSAPSAVFGRNELFQSGPLPTTPSSSGGVCTLKADLFFADMELEMSERCESVGTIGWSCPDSARQVLPEFGG